MREQKPQIPLTALVEINPKDHPSGKVVPYVSMNDVSEDARLLHIGKRVRATLSPGQPTFRDGDVLFAKITPCLENGKGAFVSGLDGQIAQGSTEFHVLRARRGAHPRFIYHWTRSSSLRRAAAAMMIGSAGQRRVPAEFFDRFLIPAHDLTEQRRIAEILDTLDSQIETHIKIIRKLSDILAGIKEAAFTPPGNPADVSSGWRKGQLGSFIQLQRGFDITVAEQREGNIPVVSSSGISSYHDKAMVKGPGVVIGRKGKLGQAYFIEGDYWPHDTSLWVKDFKGNDPEFIAHFLTWLRLERFDAATSVPTLNRNFVHPISVWIPTPERQKEIVAHFKAWELGIQNTKNSLAKLRALRQGLMEDLLTGRVRVSRAEAVLENL